MKLKPCFIHNLATFVLMSFVATHGIQACTPSATKVAVEAVSEVVAPPPPPPPSQGGKPFVQADCGRNLYEEQALFAEGIVGGITAKPQEFPFIVRIVVRTPSGVGGTCGGSVIDKNFVLTAAHCAVNGWSSFDVYFADHNTTITEEGEVMQVVKKIHIHPDYSGPTTHNYDFALLELPSSLDFSSTPVRPVCLPSTCDDVSSCDPAAIAGWGATKETDQVASTVLQKAEVPFVPVDKCQEAYNSFSITITDNMLCAGTATGGIDTCQGDSGGPLFCKLSGIFRQVGVTSFGIGCARPNMYGVYGNTCKVISWIAGVVQAASTTTPTTKAASTTNLVDAMVVN